MGQVPGKVIASGIIEDGFMDPAITTGVAVPGGSLPDTTQLDAKNSVQMSFK
jgi:hypothetical protein